MATERIGGFITRGHAEMARGYLEEEGVTARVIADDAGGAAPHFALGSGGISLEVAKEQAEQARALLSHLESHERGNYGPPPHRGMVRIGRVLVALTLAVVIVALVLDRIGAGAALP